MTAFFVATVNVDSMEWVPDYVTKVPPIVRSHGGRFLGVSNNPPDAVELIEGLGPAPQVIVLIQFPSVDAAKEFLADPAYQPYKQSRRAGSECNFFVFDNNNQAPQFIGQ